MIHLVLNAHVPFVRDIVDPDQPAQQWFFRANAAVYLPFMQMLNRLEWDRIPCRITFAVSPVLVAMWDDELLRGRFEDYLESEAESARQLAHQLGVSSPEGALAVRDREQLLAVLESYRDRWKRDVASALGAFHRSGLLNLIPAVASHPVLPLLRGTESAQLKASVASFYDRFGIRPQGLWLPECAFDPRLEGTLSSEKLRYTFIAALGLALGDGAPVDGSWAPVAGREGVAYFACEPAVSIRHHIVSEIEHGAADYRDRGVSLRARRPYRSRFPLSAQVYCHEPTSQHRSFYDPARGLEAAKQSADQFVLSLLSRLAKLHRSISDPVIVVADDAEVLGLLFDEGVSFLERVLRVATEKGLFFSDPSAHLGKLRRIQKATPGPSSWRDDGYYGTWLSEKSAWLWRYLYQAEERLLSAASEHANTSNTAASEALDQAWRELLLAQDGHWMSLLGESGPVAYALGKVNGHLEHMNGFIDMVASGDIDVSRVRERAAALPVFPKLDFRSLVSGS